MRHTALHYFLAEPPSTEPPYVTPNDYVNGIVSMAEILEKIEVQKMLYHASNHIINYWY